MTQPAPKFTTADHLMVLPVPMRLAGNRVLFEQQACNGLDRWADHFETLVVACPVIPEEQAARRVAMAWRDVESIPAFPRIEFVPLPWATGPVSYFGVRKSVRGVLRSLIERSNYLHFGIGGLFGDWAGEAADLARAIGRPYAVHMDRVEDEHVRRTSVSKSLPRRLKSNWMAAAMRAWHERLIRNAALSMCHGYDTFATYGPLNAKSFVIHNVHTSAADLATPAQVEEKSARAADAPRLKLCYAGRADAEKAPLDWVRAVGHAVKLGADVEAVWLGDGQLRPQMQAERDRLGLKDRVRLPGFTSDRALVLKTLRESDLFVFTHVTPESPRCLLESLITGTPIVGYDSHFPADLIAGHRGGVLTPIGQPEPLGEALAALASDRSRMRGLIRAAADDGSRFTSEAVFAHRSELIKEHLPAFVPPASQVRPDAVKAA